MSASVTSVTEEAIKRGKIGKVFIRVEYMLSQDEKSGSESGNPKRSGWGISPDTDLDLKVSKLGTQIKSRAIVKALMAERSGGGRAGGDDGSRSSDLEESTSSFEVGRPTLTSRTSCWERYCLCEAGLIQIQQQHSRA